MWEDGQDRLRNRELVGQWFVWRQCRGHAKEINTCVLETFTVTSRSLFSCEYFLLVSVAFELRLDAL